MAVWEVVESLALLRRWRAGQHRDKHLHTVRFTWILLRVSCDQVTQVGAKLRKLSKLAIPTLRQGLWRAVRNFQHGFENSPHGASIEDFVI